MQIENILQTLSADQHKQLESLFELFCEWNQKINLSSFSDRSAVYEKHFEDSLLPTQYISFQNARILDLGSGGGFPVLPLAIFAPSSTFHALDSVQKKMKAVQDMTHRLHLPITTHHGRIEDYAHKKEFRQQFDIVTARALAPWRVLLEYALPFVRIGGTFVAYQGPAIESELHTSLSTIAKLGGQLQHTYHTTLSSGDIRVCICIKKTKSTPHTYPRANGIPRQSPL